MRSIEEVVEATHTCLTSLATIDLSQPCDSSLRGSLPELLTAHHRLAAQVTRLVGEFDRRNLAPADGHPTTKAWLQAFTRLSGHTAHAHLRAVRTLRRLPDIAAAFTAGMISFEHVDQIRRLHDREPDHILTQVEHILLRLASLSDPTDLRKACDHVRYAAHANDGPDNPDNSAFERRQVTLSRIGDLWHLNAQLDAETGAKMRTALEAYTAPPAQGDTRTAAQRRHDALHTLLSQSLESGRPPTTGGYRPQLGVLVPLHVLIDLDHHPQPTPPTNGGPADQEPAQPVPTPQAPPAPLHRPDVTAAVPDAHAPGALTTAVLDPAGLNTPGLDPGPLDPSQLDPGRLDPGRLDPGQLDPGQLDPSRLDPDLPDSGLLDGGCAPANNGHGDAGNASRASIRKGHSWLDELHRLGGLPNLDAPNGGLGPQPAYLEGWGPISNRLAQRLACDAALYRVILDPNTGLPLDVGRAYRCAPPWIRKALWIRDRHCRWPGCKTEASWCDAHHYLHWKDQNGPTSLNNLILLCRYHHVLIHEGHWTLHFDPNTAEVLVLRPNGEPYDLGPTRPHHGTAPASAPTTSHPHPRGPDP